VWVEWGGGAAAQPRHQLLLEQPLPGLVEDPQLARRANQVRELVQQAGADAVEGADPHSVEGLSRMGALRAPGNQIRPPRCQLPGDAEPQLFGGAVAEGDGQDLVRSDPLLDEPAEPLGGGERLAGFRPGRDEERSMRHGGRGGGGVALWGCGGSRRRGKRVVYETD